MHDPRVEGRCKHSFLDVVVIAFCAILSGVESFTEMEAFAYEREDWFRKFLELKGGIPSHDTFRRVFSIVDAKELEVSFMTWAKEIYDQLRRISIDGKAVKGSVSKMGPNPLQNVAVFDHDSGLAIGQSPANNAGFGEIKGVLDVLHYLDIKKCLVSVDAANSCPSVANAIKEKKADYIMPVRDTTTNFRAEAFALFNECANEGMATTHDDRHGRSEERMAEVLSTSMMSKEFRRAYPSAKMVIKVVRQREAPDRKIKAKPTKADGEYVYHEQTSDKKNSVHEDYFITSRKMTAAEALEEIRDHWSIENKLHWHLDVSLREDDWISRERAIVRNLSVMRKMALNIVSRHPIKLSKRTKIKKAGWGTRFLEELLFNPQNFVQQA